MFVCQVPSCRKQRVSLKDFNLRCRVCTVHTRAEYVLFGDTPLRFCQQCNKFQPLEDFDGTKRTCKEKLQLHNSRRRQRRKVLQNCVTLKKRTAVRLQPIFCREERPDEEADYQRLADPDIEFANSQGSGLNCYDMLTKQDKLRPTPEEANQGLKKTSSFASVNRVDPFKTDELSSPAGTARLGSGNLDTSQVTANTNLQIPRHDSLTQEQKVQKCSNFSDCPMPQSMSGCYSDPPLQSQGKARWQCVEAWQRSQPLLGPDLCGRDPTNTELRAVYGLGESFEEDTAALHVCVGPGCHHCRAAGRETACGGHWLGYRQGLCWVDGSRIVPLREEHLVSLAVKIDDITPGEMPHDLFDRFTSIMQSAAEDMLGYIRPGCVHLTVDGVLAGGAAAEVDRVISTLPRRAEEALLLDPALPWAQGRAVVALPSGCRAVSSGGRLSVCGAPRGAALSLASVPLASSDSTIKVSVQGWQDATRPVVLCRRDGFYIQSEAETVEPTPDGAIITVRLPSDLRGLFWVEAIDDVDGGGFQRSGSAPSLATDSESVAAELRGFEAGPRPITTPQAAALLKDVEAAIDEGAASGGASESARERVAHVAASRGCAALLCRCTGALAREFGPSEVPRRWPQLLRRALQSGERKTVLEAVRYFASDGCRSCWFETDDDGLTVLHWAVLCCCGDLVQEIRRSCRFAEEAWVSAPASSALMGLTPAETSEDRARFLRAVFGSDSMPREGGGVAPSPAAHLARDQQAGSSGSTGCVGCCGQRLFFGCYPLLAALFALAAQIGPNSYLVQLALALGLACAAGHFLASGFPRLLLALHGRLNALCRGATAISPSHLCFLDAQTDNSYLSYWHGRVVRYDRFILLLFLGKVLGYMAKADATWLVLWSSPASMLLLWRCIFGQRVEQREWSNIVLAGYSFLCYFYGSTFEAKDQALDPERLLSTKSLLSQTASAALIALQYAIVYPYRLKWCAIASAICAASVACGMSLRVLAIAPPQPSLGFWLESCLLLVVAPTMWAAAGSQLGAYLVERCRMSTFLKSLGKAD
uniref:Squamosa promoter-binding-like protein 12-like n=1 Tax=Tetraselmis sp. GSL018 TaxID=582737 RepID=A0A061QZJ1_9CHLO|mmetsp:Transcript_32092/g.76272  ORF Transcript_32092/g.76272 Transcript_32092/m.76272 type:complete len:1045 (-) Transcript_32092:147-3281(-)